MPEKDAKILIVDDARENLQVLAQILRPYRKVVFALNGIDAIRIVRSESPPILVLLDIMMPEMDGFQVCEKMKKDPKTKDIPIIFVTAATDDRTLKKAFEVGGDDYVRKPVNRIELLSRIKSVLVQKRLTAKVIEQEKLKTVIEIAGGICHEMNQPLQAIASYADLLLLKMEKSHPCRQYASAIRKQIALMGSITGKLMRITDYKTTDYVGNAKIIDIERASGKNE